MRTCSTREPLLVRAIERDGVKLTFHRACFRGREQHTLANLIDAATDVDLPIATGELLLQRTVDAVKIEMPEAGALAGPEETLALAEEPRFANAR